MTKIDFATKNQRRREGKARADKYLARDARLRRRLCGGAFGTEKVTVWNDLIVGTMGAVRQGKDD